jgi:SRSO17 transposase
MMSVLDTPRAKALLRETEVTAKDIEGCEERLSTFMERYLPLFYRKEQRENAKVVMRGLLSDLERKTCEPIAYREGRERKPIQFFVGSGKWDDEAVMAELRRHVVEELGDPNGVLVFDPSAFPKKGNESVGVKHQWCGRLGKREHCQVGVFMAYVSGKGYGPLDRRLYLPEDWATDSPRRDKCHVPDEVAYQPKWGMAIEMLRVHREGIPHKWIVADAEFGRPAAFREALRDMGEKYVVDVPSDIAVRDLKAPRPPRRTGSVGRKREAPFIQVRAWARQASPARWQRFKVRDGEKGPIEVEAIETPVRARIDRRVGPPERLVVIRTVGDESEIDYVLTNARDPLGTIVWVHAARHRVEQVFEEAKGETGLAHYEVRSWIGWHHHMTLSLLALWFLKTETDRLGGKSAGADGATGQEGVLATAS